MLAVLIAILMVISIICGAITGNLNNVSAAALDSCTKAIELTIYLAGSMALWGGIMRIADKSGVTKAAGKIISPIAKKILPGIEKNPEAHKAVIMNIAANLFGLGNAATPLGITAAKELSKDKSPLQKRNLAVFVVLNTASIQLLPTTVAALRLSHEAANPFDITPAILLSSLISVSAGLITAYALYLPRNNKI